MNALNSSLTDEIISNIINGTYEYILTRDNILTLLNSRVDSLKFSITVSIIFLFFSIIIYYIIKQKRIIKIIVAIFCVFLFGVPGFKSVREKNAIEYSIENNCWSIETDLVIDKYIKQNFDHTISYCLELKHYKEVEISILMYENIEKNDEVFVVCVQDKSGEKSPVKDKVWPLEKTLIIESLSLP